MVNTSYNPSNEYTYISSYFKNEATIVLQQDAAIYLEGEDDVFFWKPVLAYALPNFKVEFYFNSNLEATENVENRSGSGECSKFFQYTDQQFIVCIDSDYKYLLEKHTFNHNNFVFQTYTYSIENHYCQVFNLENIATQLSGSFNFDTFITAYSILIYELFIFSVLSLKKEDGIFSLKQFEMLLKINHPVDLTNDGSNELNRLTPIVNAKVAELENQYDPQEITNLKQSLNLKGVTRETTYLFIKGHSLIDLEKINRPKIVNSVNRQLKGVLPKNQYLEILRNQLCFNDYWQIEKLIDDIKVKLC